MDDKNNEDVSLELKRFYDTATNNIQTGAVVNRALVDKISTETINQKVNNQLQSIYVSMNKINPKFGETSKNYGIIKQDILDILTDYELALTELSDYYDIKLENLILKKVELEANLIGKIFREESLKQDENDRLKLKEKDFLKLTFSEKSRTIVDRVSEKKVENHSIDFEDIRRLQDWEDLEIEQGNKLERKISKIKENTEANKLEINEIEKEIRDISEEIRKLNETKRLEIEKAMETREKWISTTLRRPSIWSRTKSFFSNKFTTAKVVSKTIIAPLKMKIKEFRVNELSGLKEG